MFVKEFIFNLSRKLDYFRLTPWKPKWKEDLAIALSNAQKGLPVNLVAVVAHESDLYFELLFLLCATGIATGTILSFFPFFHEMNDAALLPVIGFCIGSLFFQFRKYFLYKIAPRAVRSRVNMRAKALFYDHSRASTSSTILLYFSEMEREIVLLSSPELGAELPEKELAKIFYTLSKNYDPKNPVVALSEFIGQIGVLIRIQIKGNELNQMLRTDDATPIYFVSSHNKDNPFIIPVIKSKGDIN